MNKFRPNDEVELVRGADFITIPDGSRGHVVYTVEEFVVVRFSQFADRGAIFFEDATRLDHVSVVDKLASLA